MQLKKDIKKQLCRKFIEFYIDQEKNQIQKNIYELFYNTFIESYSTQKHIQS